MSSKRIVITALTGGMAAGLASYQGALANGMELTFSVDERLEAGRNLSLEPGGNETSFLSTTDLGFRYSTETRTQMLTATADATLRAGELPEGDNGITGFSDPRIGLSYSLTSANSSLSLSARASQTDLTIPRPLSDFENEEGELVLPEDFDELNTTGTRRSYNLGATLRTGLESPLSFTLGATASGIDNDGTGSDSSRLGLTASSSLVLTTLDTGTASVRFNKFDSDDGSERTTTGLSLGYSREISEAASLSAQLGWQRTEVEGSDGDSVDTGLTGSLTFGLDRPNGTIGITYSAARDQDGPRQTLRLSRKLDLPLGSLSGSLGLTSKDGGEADIVGSLSLRRELPTGNLSLSVNRGITTTSDDTERLSTAVAFGYRHTINDLSGLGLSLSYGVTENGGNARTDKGDLTLSYSYALTEDWSLNSGVTHRLRDSSDTEAARSTLLFVGVSRDFTVLR